MRDGKVFDEAKPEQGWVLLVDPAFDASTSFGPSFYPAPNASPVGPQVEAVFADGHTVAAKPSYFEIQSDPDCQPPPPPPPTLLPEYSPLTGADLDAVKAALDNVYAYSGADRPRPGNLEKADKFPADWFKNLQQLAADRYGITKVEITLSSAGVKDGKAVAIFQLGGTPLGSSWQVAELVKGDAGWLLTAPSFCRQTNIILACPTDVFDPSTDQGPPPVNYGDGAYGYPGPPPIAAPSTTAPPTTAVAKA
jgi:hypothetical protein